jgi:hypothetical protein
MADYDFTEAARFINEQLTSVKDAAQRDPKVLAHFRRVGALLIEAYPQLSYTEWPGWLKRHFNMTPKTAEQYMALARPDPLAEVLGRKGKK